MKLIKNKLLATGIKYSIVSTINTIINVLTGMTVLYWLDPSEIGVWNTVSIFLAYIPFLQLGIQSGLNVELPICLGKDDVFTLEKFVSSSYGFAIFISVFISVVGIVSILIVLIRSSIEIASGVVAITIIAVATSFQLHFIARFRSSRAFGNLTKIYLIQIPFSLILVYCVYRYRYYGLLFLNVVNYVIPVLLMYYYLPYKNVKPTLSFKSLKELVCLGIKLMLPVQLNSAAQTLPKWIILTYSTIEKLGLYTPALAVNSLISLLPNQIAQFFNPQMGFIYGKTNQAKTMWPFVKKMILYMPLVGLVVAVPIWILLPWGLETFFPKYIESLWAARIMCIAFIFSTASSTIGVLYTMHAFKYAYILVGYNFIGSFIIPFIFIEILQADILTSVTIGMAVTYFISYILTFIILKIVLHLPKYNME